MEHLRRTDPYTLKLILKIFKFYKDYEEMRLEKKKVTAEKTKEKNHDSDPESVIIAPGITLHQCKCALMELLNEEFSLRWLSKILIDQCKWNCRKIYITFEEFIRLYQIITTHPSFVDSSKNRIPELYELFDETDKGWVRKEEFRDLLGTDSPDYNRTFGSDLFTTMLDPNGTGRINKPQMLTLLQEKKLK